jgi:hypothetical protein
LTFDFFYITPLAHETAHDSSTGSPNGCKISKGSTAAAAYGKKAAWQQAENELKDRLDSSNVFDFATTLCSSFFPPLSTLSSDPKQKSDGP